MRAAGRRCVQRKRLGADGGPCRRAAGRRCWFGARPRGHSQWYALRPEWQKILSRTPVGLLHAQAWDDDRSQRDEACAAADIYLAVQPPHKRAFTVLRRLMWSGMKAQH
jgi:hypothetical protein